MLRITVLSLLKIVNVFSVANFLLGSGKIGIVMCVTIVCLMSLSMIVGEIMLVVFRIVKWCHFHNLCVRVKNNNMFILVFCSLLARWRAILL